MRPLRLLIVCVVKRQSIKAWSIQSGCTSQSGTAVEVAGASCSLSVVTLKTSKVALYNYCALMIKWGQKNVLINCLITPSTKSHHQAVQRSLPISPPPLTDGWTDRWVDWLSDPVVSEAFYLPVSRKCRAKVSQGQWQKNGKTHPSETDVGSSWWRIMSQSKCRHCFWLTGRRQEVAYSVTGLIDPD